VPKDRLSTASVWNLVLNAFSKSQTLALLIAGSIIGGLVGVGVIVTAAAACVLGQSLADFGLAGEVARLNVAYPHRGTVDRCVRAIVRQAPLGLLIGPAAYLLLGPTAGSVQLLAAIGLTSCLLVTTVALTAMLNGLGDFRSPAVGLGGGRLLASLAAVAAAAVQNDPAVVIGCFAVGEAVGLVALGLSLRAARSRLPAVAHVDAHVRRARLWFGIAAVVYLVTNQADTLLVASILSPEDLGLFATASTLQNGVVTFATSATTPIAYRAIGTTLSGEFARGARLLRRAFVLGLGLAVVLGATGWLVAQLIGDSVEKFQGLAHGDGPLVLGLCLAAAPLGALVAVCLVVGAGYARHRPVGMCQIQVGIAAVTAIVVGAILAGPVGAAAGTIVRDIVGVLRARRLAKPPPQRDLPYGDAIALPPPGAAAAEP
jgi:O-antigen/teichoic acid export membrane protein